MKRAIIGRSAAGADIEIDVQRLIESRLLIQANSGSGKSWAIRRLLEQTYGAAQHIVIDVEGEFHTLREKLDYVLAGQRGDCPATVQSAALLARRLLELGVSAIVDIYELGPQRQRFVRVFLEALVNAPRELWHPALIVVDEAHMFCPEAGQAESASAVIDLMTRGRKRGFAGVLATQRIAKLHKDAAAEANNKLVGRSSLDIDMKRAGAELGFTAREDLQRLRRLPAGEFFAFGPALADDVTLVKIGEVATTHPKAGQRAAPPTPPRAKIREVLAQLADLPAEAEAEARTAAELRARIAELEKRLAARPAPVVETKVVERRILSDADLARLDRVVAATEAIADRLDDASTQLGAALVDAKAAIHLAHQLPARAPGAEVQLARDAGAPRRVSDAAAPAVSIHLGQRLVYSSDPGDPRLTGPERRILEAIAWMEGIGHRAPPIEAVAFLADYRPGGGAFNNCRGALRSKGLVDYPTPGTIALTDQGRAAAPRPPEPGSGDQLRATVLARLAGPERKLLEPLIAAYPDALTVDELATRAGYGAGGGAFNNCRGRLRTLGLADYPQRGMVRAADLLFPE